MTFYTFFFIYIFFKWVKMLVLSVISVVLYAGKTNFGNIYTLIYSFYLYLVLFNKLQKLIYKNTLCDVLGNHSVYAVYSISVLSSLQVTSAKGTT